MSHILIKLKGSEYFRTPNVRIEVSKVSQTAIQRIESLNGSITSVYHTKLGLQAHVKPSKFAIKPLFEAPILENDIKYYTSKYNNGYLSDADKFDKIFKPRGYVSTVSTGQKEPIVIGNSESQTIYGSVQDVSFNYRIENMDAKLDELRVQREMRSYLFEKCKHVKEECEEEKKKRISGGIFYPGQDNWRWITVSKDKIEALQ